jgi:hypothetical protein
MFRKSVRSLLVGILLMGAALLGCSQGPSRSRAASVLVKNVAFSETIAIKVPIGNIWWDWRNVNDTDNDYPLQTLQDSGIWTIRESGQKEGLWAKEYITELTPKGAELSKSWVVTSEKMPVRAYPMTDVATSTDCWTTEGRAEPCHVPKGVVYSVLLARKKLIEVSGIATEPGGKEATVEFTWQWSPTADAKNFPGRVNAGVRNGRAAFKLYDDGWRAIQVALE